MLLASLGGTLEFYDFVIFGIFAKDIADATGLTTNLAQKIVAGRPYVSKRDLVAKKIVDEQTYWRIQKSVTVMSK